MTDTHHAPASDSAPPVPPHEPAPSDDAADMTAPFVEVAATPEPEGRETAPRQEPERYVWQPPVPQFPPRPSQAPPVQYQGPQMQQPPVYTPQGPQSSQGQTVPYVPPQGQPQPPQQGQPPQQQPPQGQQYYAPPAQSQQPQQPQQQQMQPAYAPPMYAPPTKVYAPPPAPGTSRVRVGRRFARRTVRSMGGISKVFSGARLPVAVLFLLLLGLIGWLTVDKMSVARTPKPAPNAVSSNGTIVLPAEATVVQNYINATKNDDVELGWNTLSAKEKARRLDKGEDKTVMKAYVDTLSQNRVTPNYRFVGAYGFVGPTDFSKGGIYYYVQEYAIGGNASSRPMFFVVDTGGKVDQVYDWLYQAVVSSAAQSSTASGSTTGP